MSVWGHSEVYVVKNTDTKTWDVFTSKQPRQLLVTIKWTDALRHIEHAHAPDFVEALNACRSDEHTDLTFEEEDEARAELEGRVPATAPVVVAAAPSSSTSAQSLTKNVFSLADFRKKKR